MALRLLKIAALTIFAADLLIVLVMLGAGLADADRADPSAVFGLIAAVPLACLFALAYFGTRRNGAVRLSLAILFGGIPLALVVEMIGEQHGLWPRM